MAIYPVKYTEVYQKTYEVEANSPEEAREKLVEDIGVGAVDAPHECIHTSMQVYDEAGNKMYY